MISTSGRSYLEAEMKQLPGSGWFARFRDDLAWDILTLDCILATVLEMTVAVLASRSETFADDLVAMERWVWVVVSALAIVTVVCLLSIVRSTGIDMSH
jgi:hypothetical protein